MSLLAGVVPVTALADQKGGRAADISLIVLFFLCWTIFSALLFLGSLRTNLALLIVLALMFLSYLFLTIGELAGASVVLLVIGGWLGVACALVAWYTALADMLRSAAGAFKLPMGWIG